MVFRIKMRSIVPVENAEIRDGHYVSFSYDMEILGKSKPVHEEEGACIVGDPRHGRGIFTKPARCQSGETRTFEVTYPEDYRQKRLAGKTVQYTLTIKEVKEKQLAEP